MTLAHPAWLALLLLIPLFITGAVLATRLRRKQWAAFAAPRLRSKLLRRSSPLPRWLAFSFLLAAIALLAIALARPQTRKGSEVETTRGRNILMALDLSRSMRVADLKPDRLTQAKTLCYELMETLPSDRFGLIGFAGEPYLFAPLTVDHAAVREMISQLDIEYIPVGGSDLESALELAIKTLKATGQKENALILLTDGDETTGRINELAAEAKQAGVYVFTIGVGTEAGDFVPDEEFPDGKHRDRAGNIVKSGLNAAPLKRLSQETGGRFAVATSAASIPEMVKLAVADLEQFEIAGRERAVPIDYYQWFLLPAVLFLMASILAGTRWRRLGTASAVATAACLMFMPQPVRADEAAEARRALQEGRHPDAAGIFERLAQEDRNIEKAARYRLAQGNAAYQAGDLDSARIAFSEALRSSDPKVRAAAHHGLGSLLFGSGWRRLSQGPDYPQIGQTEERKLTDAFRRIAEAILGLGDKAESDPQPKDPMAGFDRMVRKALSDWMRGEVPEDGESEGFERFDGVLSDWIDGIRHFDSALRYDPSLEQARHNRALTVKHLKRLREILEEVQENAQQIQPMPQPGEGPGEGDQPQPEGDGEGDEEGEGKGKDPKDQGKHGDQGKDPKDQGKGGDRPKDQEPGDSTDKGSKGPKPGESPEDAARRILRENADFEKGALTPGRLEYRQPEKDW